MNNEENIKTIDEALENLEYFYKLYITLTELKSRILIFDEKLRGVKIKFDINDK